MQEALRGGWPETDGLWRLQRVGLLLDWPGFCPRVFSPLASLGWAEGCLLPTVSQELVTRAPSSVGEGSCDRSEGKAGSAQLSSASHPVATFCKI